MAGNWKESLLSEVPCYKLGLVWHGINKTTVFCPHAKITVACDVICFLNLRVDILCQYEPNGM